MDLPFLGFTGLDHVSNAVLLRIKRRLNDERDEKLCDVVVKDVDRTYLLRTEAGRDLFLPQRRNSVTVLCP